MLLQHRVACASCLLSLWFCAALSTFAQDTALAGLQDESIQLLQQYLRLDTVNPPGNEWRAVDFFAAIFRTEEIPYETGEKTRGRGNIWARLQGGSEPALILLNHTDVVPANAESWSVPPLSGEIRDGYIYGRGALDMKSTGILQLAAFLALHRARQPLNRDVLFMATADEEAGGLQGAGWLAEHRPDLFQNAGYLLNEGGSGFLLGGKPVFEVEVTQKVPLWIRLRAKGQPGHGSAPAAESAVTRLISALSRINTYRTPSHITPEVAAFFKALSLHVEQPWKAPFADIQRAARDPVFLAQLQTHDRWNHALTRNTISVTRLSGSDKINVIPPEAVAELDCRLLTDQDPQEFLGVLRRVIDDPSISIEPLMTFEAAVSPANTELYQAIEKVVKRHYPDAPVIAGVGAGFTDSHYFRKKGIVCYGFTPTVVPMEEWAGIHGNDERVSVENVRIGIQMTLEILREMVY